LPPAFALFAAFAVSLVCRADCEAAGVVAYLFMNTATKPVTKIVAALFAVGAVIHLLRLMLGWKVVIGGLMLPLWASMLAIPIALVLAVLLMREAKA
jgi:uncharacterized protein (DUF983 family)